MRRLKTGSAALVLAATLAGANPVAAEFYAEDAGWGALAVLGNVFYMPAKVGYAAIGGLTGGLAFLCTGGDMGTAETIWVTSLGGDYVLTPSMLQGEKPIAFVGTHGETTSADAAPSSGGGLSEDSLADG